MCSFMMISTSILFSEIVNFQECKPATNSTPFSHPIACCFLDSSSTKSRTDISSQLRRKQKKRFSFILSFKFHSTLLINHVRYYSSTVLFVQNDMKSRSDGFVSVFFRANILYDCYLILLPLFELSFLRLFGKRYIRDEDKTGKFVYNFF